MGSNFLEFRLRSLGRQSRRFLKIPDPTRKMRINRRRKEDDLKRNQSTMRLPAQLQRMEPPWNFQPGDQREATTDIQNRKFRRNLAAHEPAAAQKEYPKRRSRGKEDPQRPKHLNLMDIIHLSNRQPARRSLFLWPIHL